MNRLILSFIFALACLQAQADALYSKFPIKEIVKTPVALQKCSSNPDGSILLDFGRDSFSQVELMLEASKPQTVRILFGEKSFTAEDGSVHVDSNPGGTIRFAEYELAVEMGTRSYSIEYRADERNTRTTPVGSGAVPILMPESIGEVYPFRYLEIVGFSGRVIEDKTRQLMAHYPFNDAASAFECSDSTLNMVWDLCKYSIKATSFCGYYVDGDRERIPYEADAFLNQLSHYGVDSEYAMARRSAAYLMEHPTWPTEWQFAMVFMAWYDYLYTGDKALISKYYDVLCAKTLCALREDNGLISTCTGKMTPEVLESINYHGTEPVKDIVDWPRSGSFGVDKKEAGEADGYVLTDYNTAVNAMHYGTLVYMEKIARVLGRRKDARGFRTQAQAHLKAFNSLLLCDDGVYRDGLDTDHRSLHANMLPLMFGMVPEDAKQTVMDFIKSRGMACSVYGSQFLLDALYEAGEADYALDLMTSHSRRSWYNMIRVGSTITMEAWDMVFKGNLDWNHAWGAAPANIIPRWLVGVQPLVPGCRKVRICPQISSLNYVKAIVPTARGGISCEYRQNTERSSFSARICIPKGVRARLCLPCSGESAHKKVKVLVNGRNRRARLNDGCLELSLRSGEYEIVTL